MLYASSNPKQPFYVVNQIHLTESQERVLTKLYQPLIGTGALGVYQTLLHEFWRIPIASEYHTLYQLQSEVDCDLRTLFEDLHKLEAVGLLKSFIGQNPILGESLMLELVSVPSPAHFFNTFLLSTLLLEKVGEVTFSKLQNQFISERYPGLKEAKEVSAGFFEVFHVLPDDAITPPKSVVQAAQRSKDQPETILTAGRTQKVDWEFLMTLLKTYHIGSDEVAHHRAQISEIMTFYHLTEQEFVDAVILTLTAGQEKLDMKAIANVVNEQAGQGKTKAKIKRVLSKSPQVPKPETSQMSSKEAAFLAEVQRSDPLSYFVRLKEGKKGGFVTASERKTLFRLQNRYGLTPALINVLTTTCLSYDSVLTSTLAERIANDWLQNGVTTPIQAIRYVQDFRQKRHVKSPNFKRMNKTVEQGTDWSKRQASHKSTLSLNQLKSLLDDQSKNH